MKNNLFEASDFQGWEANESPDDRFPSVSQWCALHANAILADRDWVRDAELHVKFLEKNMLLVIAAAKEKWLAELLRDAPVVYGSGEPSTLVWSKFKPSSIAVNVHTARLVDIKEIK